jgi:hypothetical protein
MDRRSAGSSYYFERDFFEAIHRDLAGQFAYVNAVLDSRIVSTELALVSADSVYSYLGGTDSSAFDLRPNDLLKYEIIQWARERGKLCYVLGGGRYPDDGIYKYKLSFAPGGMVPFTTGQRILDEEQYRVLTNRRRAEFQAHGLSWLDNVHFFPAYRLESTALGVQ